MQNYKLSLTYDGTRYNGWQKQGNSDNTIQNKLENQLSRLLQSNIEVNASGRTDAGVHALRQVCSFRSPNSIPCGELLAEINRYLPEDISAVSLEFAEPRFHARLNCKSKTYRYELHYASSPDIFRRKYRYQYPAKLDIPAMRDAAEHLCGTHDYTSFTNNKHKKKSAVRTILSIDLQDDGENLSISYTGDGFLYNMVRIITGTLLEVGTGKRRPDDIPIILAAHDRSAAGFTAPANGLFLVSVYYE